MIQPSGSIDRKYIVDTYFDGRVKWLIVVQTQ